MPKTLKPEEKETRTIQKIIHRLSKIEKKYGRELTSRAYDLLLKQKTNTETPETTEPEVPC